MDNDGDSEGMTPYNFSRSSHPNFQLALNGLLIPQRTIDNAEAVHINRVKTKFDMHKRQPGSALLIHTPFSPLYCFFWFVFLVCLYYIRGVQSTYGVRLFNNCCKLEFTNFFCLYTTQFGIHLVQRANKFYRPHISGGLLLLLKVNQENKRDSDHDD